MRKSLPEQKAQTIIDQTLPCSTSDPAQVKRDLDSVGIGIHGDFLTKGECDVLLNRVLEQAELEREQGVAELSGTGTASESAFAAAGAPPAPFQAISSLPNKGSAFRALMCNRGIRDHAHRVFASVPHYLTSQSATIVRKGAGAQVIHVDQQAWPFNTPVPVMLTAVVCLTDFEPEMGSTRFVPGTQHGMPPVIAVDSKTGCVANPDPIPTQAISARAGTLLLWEGRVWHGQGASTSDRDRVAVIQTFAMHMVRPQDIYAAAVHDDVYALLTDEEKELLGFRVHYEYAGRIGPRNPDDHRTNLNFRYPYVPELRRGSPARAVSWGEMRIAHAVDQAKLVTDRPTQSL